MNYSNTACWLLLSFCFLTNPILAIVHSAPVILKGSDIRKVTRYPISMYQVFKTNRLGVAEAIPFQIDEINRIGDYVLDKGTLPNSNTGDGNFDYQDELVFMGDDIGEIVKPKSYKDHKKPDIVYELKFTPPKSITTSRLGAVYIAIYFNNKITKSPRSYTVFDPARGIVETSRYRYKFDQKNYLVVRGIDVFKPGTREAQKLINSSTMFMKADMKYFVTLRANHRTLNSSLEAWKEGPVRSLVRVSFFFKFLRMNFELGMYTEVSFFSNAVILPTIMYNPIDGTKSLNKGSSFYYGFALVQNPKDYKIETNMPYYTTSNILDFLKFKKAEPFYWASITNDMQMFYMEVEQGKELVKLGNIPSIYKENVSGGSMAKRSKEDTLPLGKSPVNLGMHFDLTKFDKGEHNVSFKLFFENRYNKRDLDSFKNLKNWKYSVTNI